MRAICLFFLLCFPLLISSHAFGDDVFKMWYQEFATKAGEINDPGVAGSAADTNAATNPNGAAWLNIRGKCKIDPKNVTSTDPYAQNLNFFATTAQASAALGKPANQITFQDRLNAATYDVNLINTPGKPVRLQTRGELLARHPLAVPVNLMAWCIAAQAQKLIPYFCLEAMRLFAILLAIEWTWMGVNLLIKGADLSQIIDALVTKLHLWAFVGSLILTGFYGFNDQSWIYSIFSSFSQIGTTVTDTIFTNMQNNNNADPTAMPINHDNLSSLSTAINAPAGSDPGFAGEVLSPGSFFAMGVLVISSIWSKVTFGFDITSFLLIPVLVLATPIIIATFSKMVADIALTMLEAYLGMGVLFILAAFGATRWGGDYIQKTLLYAVMMGFKLLTMYLLFSVGVRMLAYVALSTHYVQGLSDFITAIMTLLAISMLLSFLFHRLPAAAFGLFGGSPMLSFGQLLKDVSSDISTGTKPFTVPAKAGWKVGKFAADKSGATKAVQKKVLGKMGLGGKKDGEVKPPEGALKKLFGGDNTRGGLKQMTNKKKKGGGAGAGAAAKGAEHGAEEAAHGAEGAAHGAEEAAHGAEEAAHGAEGAAQAGGGEGRNESGRGGGASGGGSGGGSGSGGASGGGSGNSGAGESGAAGATGDKPTQDGAGAADPALKGLRDGPSAGGLKDGATDGVKSMLEDTPSAGNQILPEVEAPGDD